MDKYEETTELQDSTGNCNCKQKLNSRQLFDDNLEDIATSLAQIMLICGINTTKSCQAKAIIRRAFVYHEKLRTQWNPNAAPESRLNRDEMLQALRITCGMESVEAVLSYSIIKRAFKAFFRGKPPVSLSNPIVDAMAIRRQERAWIKAAKATSKLFDNYQSAFFWAHKFYAEQIDMIYRALYNRMRARCSPIEVPLCTCRGCSKQVVPKKLTPKDGYHLHKASSLCDLPRCDECNGRFLICEGNSDKLTAEQYGKCGQDSYKVKWCCLEDEQPQPKPKSAYEADMAPEDEDHYCPVDCTESSDVCPSDVGSLNLCDCVSSSEDSIHQKTP
ncbi:GL21992 [Drosophila persimilis]|uniref:GL21992 n=1 Tax=Drosophila persimilis TaxID=7234 RepID=B4GEB9_DROPE|nr:uncharacterized protein LOC6591659 [Drosophila persimilis]EDW33954.1 GL21992 [Drosophila persimilis]